MGRTLSPKTSGQMLLGGPNSAPGQTLHDSDPNFNLSSHNGSSVGGMGSNKDDSGYPFGNAYSKTDTAALAKMVQSQNPINEENGMLQKQSAHGQLQNP